MKKGKVRKVAVPALFIFTALVLIAYTFSGCGLLSNTIKNVKGELIGNHFNIEFYDNFGNNILNIEGTKVGLEANYVNTKSVDSDGVESKNYELSSVITMTVDGNQVAQTGNTIIFAEDGLKKLEDFELPDDIATSGGTINIFDRNINEIKNILGTPKVVIVCSQLGVPVAVYGGKQVYWEIPNDLPKTTKLNIDGLALYIHRANYILLDNNMIK
ncbi:MAG: DUF5052 family protein [Clostridia bacterium]|jgi:hypothetical protein|nr:DUF5052 family protein [Clostridia bacterium]